MKSITSKKIVAVCTVLMFAIISLTSCGTSKYNFNTSSIVPAAEGSVKVKRDGNDNYKIDLSIMRLADPQRLSPAKEMYIVWMETEQNGRKNLGQLKTSSSFLSNTLKSSLKTVTPFKPISFFITAENEAGIQFPGDVILSTRAN